MMTVRHPSRRCAVKPGRLGRDWLAAFAVALMMAGAVMAQGSLSKSTERLFDAVFKNDMTAVKSSIPAGANLDAVNSWGQTPVDLAVDLGYFEIAHFLTSLRHFEKREQEESQPPIANTFLTPQFSPPTVPEPLSPSVPAPARAPEPTPPPLPGGAFDPTIASQGSVLSVIGDIRGPQGTAVPEAFTPSPLSPSLARPVAAVQTPPSAVQVPASSAEPMAAAPARDDPGFISNLWGQLADAFTDEPEEVAEVPAVAEPVAAVPEEEGPGFISNMLGQLKEAFTAAPKDENAHEPVVAFPQAKPSPEKSTGEDAVLAVKEPPVQPAPSPAPVETAAQSPEAADAAPEEEEESFSDMMRQMKDSFSAAPKDESAQEPVVAFPQAKPSPEQSPGEDAVLAVKEPPVQPAPSPAPVETAAQSPEAADAAPEEEEESFSDMMRQMKDSFSAAPGNESVKEPVVAFGQANSPPGDSPVESTAKAPEAEVAAAEAAKKTSETKPIFYDRLAKFLSLENDSTPRSKSRKRRRLNTETAMIRFPMPASPSEFLKGVVLDLSGTPNLGKPAPSIETCISKNRGSVLFCIEPVVWPEILRPHFKVNTYMYGGAKSIVRYDDGKATFVHVLFPAASFQAVLEHFKRRFGPPTEEQELWLTSLSSPARSNPMASWWSIEGDGITSLQIRNYDDTRGGFPDMEYGAISLQVQGAKPIFPLLSTANLMLLKFKRSP